MDRKILVTYASRTGSTQGVAEEIGKIFSQNGTQVDVLPMQDVKELSSYSAVIAGSSIRGQKWLPEAVEFIQTHRSELSTKRFAAFMVCITLAMAGSEKFREGVSEWMSPVRSIVRPVSVGLFPGGLDLNKLSGLDGLKMRAAVAAHIFPNGDHRDWEAVRAWAYSLEKLL